MSLVVTFKHEIEKIGKLNIHGMCKRCNRIYKYISVIVFDSLIQSDIHDCHFPEIILTTRQILNIRKDSR
jgi:hypothetical protein